MKNKFSEEQIFKMTNYEADFIYGVYNQRYKGFENEFVSSIAPKNITDWWRDDYFLEIDSQSYRSCCELYLIGFFNPFSKDPLVPVEPFIFIANGSHF